MNQKNPKNGFLATKKAKLLLLCEITVVFLLGLLVYDITNPLSISVTYSKLVVSDKGEVMHAFLSKDEKWRMYIEPEEISPLLKQTFLEKEDKYFYYHLGVNPLAVIRAGFNNLRKGKRTSGASTITMQVVRLLNPRKRTYANKFKEILESFQLELKLSKDEILNLYLNLVPFGGNVEGVKSVSILYLNKMPDQLSLAECVALSSIPNQPNSLRPGRHNQRINEVKNFWLKKYLDSGVFEATEIAQALSEDFKAKRIPTPKSVPHLSRRLKQENKHWHTIPTSISMNLQNTSEQIIRSYSKGLSYRGIHNAAIIVVERETMQVKAYVGSPNFEDNYNGGQVDGVIAVRSPGSTLKPYLYGVALESGIITPKRRMLDVPINFHGYEPENYDGNFKGAVTARTALAQSLNIPAVNLLDEYGIENFIQDLEKARFDQIVLDKQKLGLSLILGGCGVTLENLTELYGAFANNGVRRDLNYMQNDASLYKNDTLLSASSTYILNEILLDVTRPDLPLSWRNTSNLPAVAWKTGTSYGRKDAWSIGFNDDYIIGVWVGNFNGIGVPEMSGSSAAAPLLFQLFNAIDQDPRKRWLQKDSISDFRQVCAKTGRIPSDNCTDLIIDDFIPGISSTLPCDHIKSVWVNQDSTISYCRTCLPEVGYVQANYEHYPKELVSWYVNRRINYELIPDHNPKCERVFTQNEPRITSPVEDLTYYVDIADSTEISLSCQVYNDVRTVYWYVNDQFLQEASAQETVFFFPKKGHLKVSCVDDKGRMSHNHATVKYSNF